jgi:hypothetical protein
MRRSGRLRRLTPLQRRTPLRAKTSDPTELRKAKKVVHERSGGWCEGRVPLVCTHAATDVHHLILRSRGGTHDPATLVHLCRACHTWTHHHPSEATERGLMKRRGG